MSDDVVQLRIEPFEVPAALKVHLMSDELPGKVAVLPWRFDDDTPVYRDADLAMVKQLRAREVQIDYATSGGDRVFISEYSAEIVVAVALFIAEALGEEAVGAVAGYFAARVRRAVATVGRAPRVVVRIARVAVKNGERELEGVQVEGDGEQVVAALKQILRDPASSLPPERK